MLDIGVILNSLFFLLYACVRNQGNYQHYTTRKGKWPGKKNCRGKPRLTSRAQNAPETT